MAARALLADVVLDEFGQPIAGAVVRVCNFGTSTPVTVTVYADSTTAATLSYDLVTDTYGRFLAWFDPLDAAALGGVVALLPTKSGVTFGSGNVGVLVRPEGRSATLIVAASNASASMLASADFVCDGIADEVQINAALDTLPADGGRVQLSEGTFTLSDSITVGTRKSLVGMGARSTIINNGSNTNPAIKSASGATQGIYLAHFEVTGGSGAGAHGIYMELSTQDLHVSDVNIFAVTGVGAYFVNCWSGSLRNSVIQNGILDGIKIEDRCHNFIVDRVLCASNGGRGIHIAGGIGQPYTNPGISIKILNSAIQNNTNSDIYASLARNLTIRDCYFEHQDTATSIIKITDSGGVSFIRATHISCCSFAFSAPAAAGGIGIEFDRAIGLVSESNFFSSVPNMYKEGAFGGNSDIDVGRGDTRLTSTWTYRSYTRGTGSVSSGATSATITHGLGRTPLAAEIAIKFTGQGANDWGRWSLANIGATTFDVVVSADPGAGGLPFHWSVQPVAAA